MTSQTAEFDRYAAEYEACCQRGLDLSGEDKHYFARGRLDFLQEWLAKRGVSPPDNIVDYGCGVGDVTAQLSNVFPSATVTGVDVSQACIDKAATIHSANRVHFGHTDNAPDGQSIVHCNGVIHHVEQTERRDVFKRMADCLRPGGHLFLFENNPLNPGTHLVMRRIPFDRDAHMISHWGVARLCQDAGLELLETAFLFYFPRPLAALRPLERWLLRVPLGAQYVVIAHKRHA